MDPLVIEDNGRVPFGPLPVDASALSELLVLPCSLYVASGAVGVPSITPAQRLRDATALIFGNVSNDSTLLIQPSLDLCTAFAQACACSASVEGTEVMKVLLRAEVTVTLNFGIPAAVEWADAFVSPLRCGRGIGCHYYDIICPSNPCCMSSTNNGGIVIYHQSRCGGH